MAPIRWQTPAGGIPDSVVCRPLYIPAGRDWLALVNAAIYELTLPENYVLESGDVSADDTAARFEQMFSQYRAENCGGPDPMYPSNVTLFHIASLSLDPQPIEILRIPWTYSGYENITHAFGHVALNNDPAEGNQFEQSFTLAAGVYRFGVLGIAEPANAIITFELDSVQIAVTDWYETQVTPDVWQYAAGIEVATAGAHVLRGRTLSRNAASGGWYHALTCFTFVRTGDL